MTDDPRPSWDWSRMRDQAKAKAIEYALAGREDDARCQRERIKHIEFFMRAGVKAPKPVWHGKLFEGDKS